MSHHSHRNQTSAVPTAPRVSHLELISESTPAKKKYGPDLQYTSRLEPFEEIRRHLGKEMEGHWLGAMPVDDFFDRFLPPVGVPLPGPPPKDAFENVPSDGRESDRYVPFISAIEGWSPHLHAVNTSTKLDKTNDVNLKTDISFYRRVDGQAPPDGTNFSEMELWMEFKTKTAGNPFQDPCDATTESRLLAIKEGSFTPNTTEGIKARGQLAHYAGALHSLQFRNFSFSVSIQGDYARFLRWEPSVTVVTAAFNYREAPEKMAEFLWRFDHLSSMERGRDESIRQATLAGKVDGRVRSKLGIKDSSVPLYQYDVPGLDGIGHAYGPRPPTVNRSLSSRCTRSLPVVWIPNEESSSDDQHDDEDKENRGPWSGERLAYLKDTWRFLADSPDTEVLPEHEIYEILHRHGTPNIPEHVAGGDVQGGRTHGQDLLDAPWLCVKPRITRLQHYRLLHGIVGRALFKFECTKQLVTGVFDALQAHWHAFDLAKILHRDISSGNIILTDEGRGLLIDWELAKKVDEKGSRRPDRTGTWQFMSANLLQNPGRGHTLADDLESFLHVLAWMMLRYIPASESYRAEYRGADMQKFDEYLVLKDDFDRGGRGKSDALGRGSYPSTLFHPRTPTPFCGLLEQLSEPFKSLYALVPPTTEPGLRDWAKSNPSEGAYDEVMEGLSRTVRKYQHTRDMNRLKSSTWFINEIKDALGKEEWPTDDGADVDLRISYGNETEYQTQMKENTRKHLHETLERSKGVPVSTGSKRRAASPTPQSDSKRRRITPPSSATGN